MVGLGWRDLLEGKGGKGNIVLQRKSQLYFILETNQSCSQYEVFVSYCQSCEVDAAQICFVPNYPYF